MRRLHQLIAGAFISSVPGVAMPLPANAALTGTEEVAFIMLRVTDILGFTQVFAFTRPIQ